ncbi:nucleotidyltransferase family protein, partial [Acinetobacter baumannii]
EPALIGLVRRDAAMMAALTETSTCMAPSLGADGVTAGTAPFGLSDLFAPVIGPTPCGRERREAFDPRIAANDWPRRR